MSIFGGKKRTIAQTKIQFECKKQSRPQKLFRKCGFISTLQNLERAKNGDCIGIRCGLGQSGVDDGAGGRMVGHGKEKPE